MSRKILVIDDEPDVLEFQKAYLTRKGYPVFVATNMQEAIEIIRKESPDIAFCDLRLKADSTGLDILAQAKKIRPEMVVYLISGFIDNNIEEKSFALGAKEILTKPISNADLERKVKEAFSSKTNCASD